MSSYQDVDWSSAAPDGMPTTHSPVSLAIVIRLFESFSYKLDGQWPMKPILNFVKDGSPPITILEPDFRSSIDGRPCYDRDMVLDMFERTIVRGDVKGGTQLRMNLREATKH